MARSEIIGNNGRLNGHLPNELGNLSQLLSLTLSYNQLIGPIPSELGNLSQLESLFLNNNQLSGDIPLSLTQLTELYYDECGDFGLDFGYNHLTASDAELLSFLDIKDPDWAENQTLALLECATGGNVSVNPPTLDFGTEAVGESLSLTINTRSQNCSDLQVDTIEFTGNNASEFIEKNKECYDGESQGQTLSACQFTIVFSPTAAGIKEASFNLTFNDANVRSEPMPLQANALDPDQPNMAVYPSAHDFGTVMLGRGPFNEQTFTIENTGNVNLKFENMTLTGADAEEFSFYGDCSSKAFMRPEEQCQFSAKFIPTLSTDDKQAFVHIRFNGLATKVPLTGTVTKPANCSEANITIASSGDGFWGASNSWERNTMLDELGTPSTGANNTMPDEFGNPNTWADNSQPTEIDVVQIKSGHTITGVPFAKVKTLCIEPGGTLASLDNQGTALEIQATDYIQNKGTLLGKDGTSETDACANQESVGTGECAYPGASVILKVGTRIIENHEKAGDLWWESYASGGPIYNAGEIKAGNGGDGSQYAAPGGDAIVLGRDTTNTRRIQAGNGGNLTGTNSGEAGKGGNLWLISLPNVHLSGGQHEAGTGGTDCVGGTDGEDGWVRIEPNVIDLSGAGTTIKGGDIAIYGGNDWTLDLSNISGTVIAATGDITLAVGEGGIINMQGSTGAILQAGGQVQIFSNEIMRDENLALSDLIQATDIIVGPSKILREVSVTSPGKLLAEPETTLPVNLTLSNNGPEADTYTISVTDSAGWTLDQLPSSLEVNALSTVGLVLNVTLPATFGMTDVKYPCKSFSMLLVHK